MAVSAAFRSLQPRGGKERKGNSVSSQCNFTPEQVESKRGSISPSLAALRENLL